MTTAAAAGSVGKPMENRSIIDELVAAQADPHETTVGVVTKLERLCHAAVQNLTVLGAAVSLASTTGSAGVAANSGRASAHLDEVQFDLGEGPSHDAFVQRRPSLVADLNTQEGDAWPTFRLAALAEGVSGVFAFPLQVGATTFGIFTIYTKDASGIESERLGMALTMAEVATEIILDESSTYGGLDSDVETALTYRAEIYQAQGMVMVRLGISLADALVRMRAYAYVHDLSLVELAHLIISDEVTLDA